MKIRSVDFLLARLATRAAPVLVTLGNLESRWLRPGLSAVPIEQPVFLTGLARSGTTILLEELSKVPGVATHRYRDFPFLAVPYVWHRFVNRFAVSQEPVERPHRDRIRITADSPEAFEEPIWQYFFPHVHAPDAVHPLGGDRRHEEFDLFFHDHLRKILLIRGGNRYLSKGNYNVTRIEYLARLFPDARFVVPVRHALAHVHSLVRQHELFCGYSREDPRTPQYLAAAGHYEFGPQRVPIRVSRAAGDRVFDAWTAGDDYGGYAIQWAAVYRFVHELRSAPGEAARRMLVVRYEDFCSDPRRVMREILAFTGLEERATFSRHAFDHIAPPDHGPARLPAEVRRRVWQETADVAPAFGYLPPDEAG